MDEYGIFCAYCGEYLDCDECRENEEQRYCSIECARKMLASKFQVCNHKRKQ